jgi:D-xylose transport system permease protein
LSVLPDELSATVTHDDHVPTKRPYTQQLRKIYQGDTGLIPIIIGLVCLVIYFQARNSIFLSSGNLTNLFIQSTAFILLSMAEIWLLLLGEIDLSLGFVSGLGAAVTVILVDTRYHWAWYLAVLVGLAITTGIGAISGLLVIRLRLPSFIVTLAGLLGYQGVLIYLIDRQGTGGVVPLQNSVIRNFVYGDFTPIATWIFLIALAVLFSIFMLRSERRRRSSGLQSRPHWVTILKIVLLAAVAVFLAIVFNTNRSTYTVIRGMPFAIPIVMAMLAAGSFVLIKTKAGRYLYAIGGNSEAARRSGVNINRFRLMAFAFGGLTAGISGLLYASNLGGISDSIDGGNLVLYAVAGAVIGGTSLFGGRGKMVHALVGGVIIATIYNGMALIGMSAATQYIATGLVLVAAVAIDSVARRGSTVTG